MGNFKTKLYELFKEDSRLWDKDKKELNETLLKDLIDKLDEKVIELLLNNEETKEKFFIKVKDVFVLKQNELKFFIDENKIDNSYTQYKNKIGLRVGSKLLTERDEVVLDWPFKDCVLEGGMTKEDQKRNEIFFNEVLAKDEIDRLYEPKALVNWKRYTVNGKETLNTLKRNKDNAIIENLIIKGNNLLALHSLKEQFTGKVKLIYIDPPYNPDNPRNTFTYNNNFKHSSWLTFMKNRLEIVKLLLKDDGVLQIAIDENEQARLGVLIDELFKDYEKHCITIVHNPRGVQGTNFSYTNEFVYFVFKKGLKVIHKIKRDDSLEEEFKDHGGESLRSDAKNCFYPVLVENNKIIGFGEVPKDDFHPKDKNVKRKDGILEVWPIDVKSIERKWVFARQSIDEIKDKLFVKSKDNGEIDIFRIKDEKIPRTVWFGSRYDASTHGSKIVNKVIEGKTVSFPKSLYAVYDCIYSVVKTDKEAIILDFFAGSGTTANAVMMLNNEDGGNRKFILVEQLDEHVKIATQRVKNEIKKLEGGGDFVYFELAKWNEEAKEKILEAKSLNELVKLFDELYERYFLNYNVKTKEFRERIIKEKNFINLTLDEQKRLFIEMLDMNQMYVNFSERNDEKYCLSQEDIRLTEDFYNGKK